MSRTETTECYVDTCFLMQKQGRDYICEKQLQCKVIHSVKQELQRLADTKHGDAVSALEFLSDNESLLEQLCTLPEERDIAKSLPDGVNVCADSVFRRIAIRHTDENKPVHFLTADAGLAAALSVYAGVAITFYMRMEERIDDWGTFSIEYQKRACQQLGAFLNKCDVVVTSSALRSPHIETFLRNVKTIGAPSEQLPIVHRASLDVIAESFHTTRKVLRLLNDSTVVRHCEGETAYCTEAAMLDAAYFARSTGRPVCILVSDWSVADRYDARTRSAEIMPDGVCFYVLNIWGEPYPLLKDWRLLRAVEAAEERTSAEHTETQGAKEPVTSDSDKALDDKTVLLSRLTLLMKADKSDAVKDMVGDSPLRLGYALLCARRWGKRDLLSELMAQVVELPAVCLDNWFKEAKTSPYRTTNEKLLSDDELYQYLLTVVEKTPHAASAVQAVAVLTHLARHATLSVSNRAKHVLLQLKARGAHVGDKDVKMQDVFDPKHITPLERKHQTRLVTIVRETKVCDLLNVLADMVKPEELPILKVIAIKVSRRQNRPSAITALLKGMESLPSCCFEQWFARSKSADSPRARDLLLRKSFFDITRRIVRLSGNLQSCRASMQTLQHLAQDADETVRLRADNIIQLALEKGAPQVKKAKA